MLSVMIPLVVSITDDAALGPLGDEQLGAGRRQREAGRLGADVDRVAIRARDWGGR